MTEPVTTFPLAKGLLSLALWLAPRDDQIWLREMALELAFIEGRSAQLSWGAGALRFALGARLGAPSRSRSWPLALGALVVMALALPLVVTWQSARETRPVLTDARERARGDSDEALAEAREQNFEPLRQIDEPPAASASPEPMEDSAPAGAALAETDASSSDDIAEIETEAPAADASETAARAEQGEDAVLVVPGGRVELEITEVTRLALYRGPPTDEAQPFFERLVTPGERYRFEVPFYIETDNAGGIRVLATGQDLGLLGLSGEAQTRRFE